MSARRPLRVAVILLALMNPIVVCHAQAPPAAGSGPAWNGIYPTVLTPFCKGGVDLVSLEGQLRHELQAGVHGLVVLSGLGEGAALSLDQRAKVIATAVRLAGPARPVVVGIQACDLKVAQTQALQAREYGASALLVQFAGNPRAAPAEVYGFVAGLDFSKVLPIFYDHAPAAMGFELGPQAVAGILGLPGVVGIREAVGDLAETQAHMRLTRGAGRVFLSGTATNLTGFLELGGNGAMCPEAVLMPAQAVRVHYLFARGNREEAAEHQKALSEVAPILRCGCFQAQGPPQARMKFALHCMGIPTAPMVSDPLPPLTVKDQHRICSAVRRIKCTRWWDADKDIAPVPLRYCREEEDTGGVLLKTGSFILGPGVGKDQLNTVWDGRSGFWGPP